MLLLLTFTTVLTIAVVHAKPTKEKNSLSPATWPRHQFQRLEMMSLRKNPRPKPLAFSKVEGLVAGTTNVLAVHAGLDAMRKGGNAMDACIATAMAEISLTAGAQVSFAGVVNILYYDHVTDQVNNLDAGWKIPQHRDKEQVPSLETLGDSVLVPGIIAGMFEAAEFSKFPLSKLLEPALYFAESGFKMTHSLSKTIKHQYNKRVLLRTDQGSEIFTNLDTGQPYEPTQMFRQPKLAEFIRNIQRYGKRFFYQGKWAKQMVDTIQRHGGHMTLRDMAHYKAQWIEPASTTYNGYHVTTTGSDWGGVELIEMLKLMRLAGFPQENDTYLTNASKLLSLISISRYSDFISTYLHAKPGATEILREYFQVNAMPSGRMSNKSAREIWGHLSNREGLDMVNALMTELLTTIPDVDRHREYRRGSSGIVATDKEGNVCSMSHTANSRPWGTGLFVQGVALPHSGAVFQDLVARGHRRGRLPSGLQPVIIFRKKTRKTNSSKNVTPPQVNSTKCQKELIDVSHKPARPNLKHKPKKNLLAKAIMRQRKVIEVPLNSIREQIITENEVEEQNTGGQNTVYEKKVGEKNHVESIKKWDNEDEEEWEDEDDIVLEDLEEPQTIGGFFNENDIDDIFRNNKSDTTKHSKRKNWFTELIRQILLNEKKKQKFVQKKKKRKNRVFRPMAALSVVGQSATEAILQYINNLLDNDMTAKQVLDAPTFFSSTPSSFHQDVRIERFTFSNDVINDVRSRGQNISEVKHKLGRTITGIGAVLTVDKNKRIYGCSHPDSEGFAEGY